MPESPPSRCAHCGSLYTGRRCECQTWTGGKRTRSWSNGTRTNDRRWLWIRALRLVMDPMCCEIECNEPATEVDHIDGTDYGDHSGVGASWLAISMTRSMCSPHHRSRTGRQGAAARWGSKS